MYIWYISVCIYTFIYIYKPNNHQTHYIGGVIKAQRWNNLPKVARLVHGCAGISIQLCLDLKAEIFCNCIKHAPTICQQWKYKDDLNHGLRSQKAHRVSGEQKVTGISVWCWEGMEGWKLWEKAMWPGTLFRIACSWWPHEANWLLEGFRIVFNISACCVLPYCLHQGRADEANLAMES